jgi:hypothetical protein
VVGGWFGGWRLGQGRDGEGEQECEDWLHGFLMVIGECVWSVFVVVLLW